jgi:chlorobactene glucosyltransferase
VVNVAQIRRVSRAPAPPPGSARPRISVVVPARNEERDVEEAVRSHLAQDYPDLEVIVVDDRSTDATGTILERLAASDPRLTVVRGTEPPPGWLGKPHALFQGASRATGELLLFADADVVFGPSALRQASWELEAERLDLLGLFPKVVMSGFWENVLLPYLALSYFFGPAFWINSDRQKRAAAGAGAGMLMRASAYRAAGGHEAIRASVIDDMGLAIRVRRAGGRCRMAMADDLTHLRMYRGFREVFDGFTKNLAFVFEGRVGAFLVFSTLFTFVAWTLPAVVLLAALAGLPVPAADVRWSVVAYGLTAATRAAMGVFLGYPFWSAFTQPLTAFVWMGITVRSLAWRFVRRELHWRGRAYDATRAGF